MNDVLNSLDVVSAILGCALGVAGTVAAKSKTKKDDKVVRDIGRVKQVVDPILRVFRRR